MSIQYITNPDDAVKKTTITENLVSVKLTTRHPSGTIQCEWDIDFSNATHQEILELAKRSVVIMQQSTFRKCDRKDLESFQSMTIDVHEFLNRERIRTVKIPTVDSVAEDAKKLTPEQLAESIARLQELVDNAE